MAVYKVAEIFSSINGEGLKAGQTAVFVRLQGCALQCSYCDTVWANTPDCDYRLMTTGEIMDRILSEGIRNVTLTGGEPLQQPQIADLLTALAHEQTLSAEIETNGSIPLSPFADLPGRPSFTMDYKLPGSGMEARMHLPNLSVLDRRDVVKFVISDERDLQRAKEITQGYGLTDQTNVYFSPVFGSISPETIVNFMKEHRLNGVTLQLQLHKIIWDPEMRGV